MIERPTGRVVPVMTDPDRLHLICLVLCAAGAVGFCVRHSRKREA